MLHLRPTTPACGSSDSHSDLPTFLPLNYTPLYQPALPLPYFDRVAYAVQLMGICVGEEGHRGDEIAIELRIDIDRLFFLSLPLVACLSRSGCARFS